MRETTPESTSRIPFPYSMARMIGMALQDREGTINLFQQDDPSQFMRYRDPAQRNAVLCRLARRFVEPICRAYREDQGQRILVLVIPQKPGPLLRRHLFSPRIH